MKNVLITGGCGYKGSVLVPKLLKQNYKVRVIDLMWFKNSLEPHQNLIVIKKDIRNITEKDLEGIDQIVHLASVANDPCSDLNPKASWEVNVLGTLILLNAAVKSGIKRIIFASSSSVYGIKKNRNVTENLDLNPITDYNKTKMIAERILLSFKDLIDVTIVRPATVCGLSSRMRFDVSVNMLTIQALRNKLITVYGGQQTRPNIHIDDITELYFFLLEKPNVLGIYNAGFENLSINSIANSIVKKIKNTKIEKTFTNDKRSYHISSQKLLKIGFLPKKNINNAIDEITNYFNTKGIIESDINHNVKWLKKNDTLGFL